MLYTLLTVFGIGLVIFIHELGHYWAARYVGIRVEAFSIGFGPRLFGWKRGTVDWKVCLIPLGGYVKMAGEDPTNPTTGRDDEFGSKTVGQRVLVISAGVIMNMIFALIAIPIAFTIGVPFQAPIVGTVRHGGPAFEAGLMRGDRILAVDGRPVVGFIDVRQDLATGGEVVAMEIERDGERQTLMVRPEDFGRGIPEAGIHGFYEALQVTPRNEYPDGFDAKLIDRIDAHRRAAGIRDDDRVVLIDGVDPLLVGRPTSVPGQPAYPPHLLTLEAPDGNRRVVTLEPLLLPVSDLPEPHREDDRPPSVIMGVALMGMSFEKWLPSTPTERPEGLLEDDLFVRWPGGLLCTPTDLSLALGNGTRVEAEALDPDTILPASTFEVLRGDELTTITLHSASVATRRALLRGLDTKVATKPRLVVGADTRAAEAGLRTGDLVTSVNGTPVSSWESLLPKLRELGEEAPNSPVQLGIVPLERVLTLTLPPSGVRDTDLILAVDGTPVPEGAARPELRAAREVTVARTRATGVVPVSFSPNLQEVSRFFAQQPARIENHRESFLNSFAVGFVQTQRGVQRIVSTLGSIFQGRVDSKHLGGIISIYQTSKQQHELAFTRGLLFLALISINLAVLNILPIPVLDGGWLMFLIIERIKGSPPSERVMGIAQTIGLVMVLSLMVYVTWNDIRRLLGWI